MFYAVKGVSIQGLTPYHKLILRADGPAVHPYLNYPALRSLLFQLAQDEVDSLRADLGFEQVVGFGGTGLNAYRDSEYVFSRAAFDNGKGAH